MSHSVIDLSSMLQDEEDEAYEPTDGFVWYTVGNYRAVHFEHRCGADRLHVPMLPSIDAGASNQRLVLGIVDK